MVFRCVGGQMVQYSPSEETAMQALQAGQIPAADLYREVLADRDRLLEEIRVRDEKIAELERCIALGAEMIECLSQVKA